jgi:hypothetical protein
MAWVISGVTVLIGWFATRRRANLFTLSCHLVAINLFLLLTCKQGLPQEYQYSNGYAIPAGLVLAPLSDLSWRTPGESFHRLGIYLCQWAALILNFFWVRHWAIVHFDALTGRTLQRQSQPHLPVALPRDDRAAADRLEVQPTNQVPPWRRFEYCNSEEEM